LSELVLNYNMTKFSEIWVNGTRNADDKAIPWTASTSERSKIKVQRRNMHHFKTIDMINLQYEVQIW
jgi:hypothetical protein